MVWHGCLPTLVQSTFGDHVGPPGNGLTLSLASLYVIFEVLRLQCGLSSANGSVFVDCGCGINMYVRRGLGHTVRTTTGLLGHGAGDTPDRWYQTIGHGAGDTPGRWYQTMSTPSALRLTTVNRC